MVIEGVDYSTARPSPAGLYAAGKRFASRYIGPGTSPKHLTATEATALRAAGIAVVLNAEGATSGLQGRTAGISWATMADDHARQIGAPSHLPIYFSADWQVTAAQWPGVAEALRGAASVIGAARVGLYGSYDAIGWAVRDGVAAWLWQTYAWSAGRWHPAAHVQQYRNGVALAGGDVDLDRAMVANYGQWAANTEEGDDMAKIVRVKEDGACWVTNGPQRWHVQTEEDLAAAVALWGPWTAIDQARLGAFGADVAADPASSLGGSVEVTLTGSGTIDVHPATP